FVWEDARTRYTLRLPYDTVQPVELEASDRQGQDRLAEREATAVALDRRERKQRLDAGKPFVRLTRALERIRLGMKRTEVRQSLPRGQAVLKRDLERPDGHLPRGAGQGRPVCPAAAVHPFRRRARFRGAGAVRGRSDGHAQCPVDDRYAPPDHETRRCLRP